ncbi:MULTISPECIES: TetR/AcrR family transcriptional regulator [unclassified Streptomyces]|uniref:TetR/AcrR family transcriptional regulator n=1 Tax=unclassified Streptomyces TaxID=2593676 RepID=UPI00190B48BC|nr:MULTISPECIES: TetR/AcrR family transcriptional regulator [unclassified Streptomyces]MBK3563892.1 TetR family transcriptional regulator [Streptomyces sp. MBT62]MBK6009901.1 TetR family transcriptional regulator [Streptomyces sp. MBT53]
MVDTPRVKPGLREMTRRAVRAQIAETAMTLFAANGFERTTVDQIAAEVGMSGRSVFRYFPTKEDMVVGHMDEIGDRLAEALAARPLGEDPWTALRHAVQPHLDELTAHADTNIAVARMLDATPALQPSLLDKRARWAEALLPDIVRRLRGPTRTRELRARAIVSSALACLNIAVDEWARTGATRPVGDLLDTALTAVRD